MSKFQPTNPDPTLWFTSEEIPVRPCTESDLDKYWDDEARKSLPDVSVLLCIDDPTLLNTAGGYSHTYREGLEFNILKCQKDCKTDEEVE